jgi:hypothetical protein
MAMAREVSLDAVSRQGLLDQHPPSMVVGAIVNAPAAADEFFGGDTGLVSVFDFDYDLIIDFKTQLQTAQLVFCPFIWPFACIACYPCFLKKNVEWDARAQHVALTVDGIRYVKDKRKSLCGFSCTDKGRESKTVPYDKITDCDVQEPAGTACCCCIPNVLSKVHVDTASSGKTGEGQVSHELSLEGLRHHNEFKQAVWAMKRGEAPANASVPMAGVSGQMSAPSQAQMNTTLLTEIRDELRSLNAHLRAKP